MSELNNPLFENERDFLERQKEEYKNALMGDVDQIKSQGQQIGKKVAMAGGVLVAGYLIKSLFSGGSKKKAKQERKGKKQRSATPPVAVPANDYDSMVHEQEDAYTLSSERMPHADRSKLAKPKSQGFMKSEVGMIVSQQLVALLMMYATKKVDEYLRSVSENNDIAAVPVEVTEIETTEYIVPQENAL